MENLYLLRSLAIAIDDGNLAYDQLASELSKSRFVLIGEASHGTAEFYRDRAYLSKVLIRDYGFNAVVIEGDWPDTYELTRYISGQLPRLTGEQALSGFKRFPSWMWRNQEMLHFIEWLQAFNLMNEERHHQGLDIQLLGMDLYSLFTSMEVVTNYLEGIDQEMALNAKKRFSCFDHYDKDSQLYGYMTSYSKNRMNCEQEVIDQLLEMLKKDKFQDDEYFSAIQNARLIKNAEQYYRNMFSGKVSSWNLRDQHMVETISNIDKFLANKLKSPAKLIIWAHNSHIGDARFTQQGRGGEHNVGQLMRKLYPGETFLLGFTTFDGNVTAASEWGASAECKKVNKALSESVENLFHKVDIPKFYLITKDHPEVIAALPVHSLERAIGVVYLPETERQSHYFYVDIANQFDAIIHIDKTSAVQPIENISIPKDRDVPETYPSGM
ncbi:MAG: erythromycin esterase family protein [Methylococcales bacterium]